LVILPENGILSFFKNPYGEILSVEYTPPSGVSSGSIFLCKVVSKSETLKGFFVDCTTLKGFLPFKEVKKETKVGDLKILQLKREEVENKPPLFTENLKLPNWLSLSKPTDFKKPGLLLPWKNYFSQIGEGIRILTNSRSAFNTLTKAGFETSYIHTEDLIKKLPFSESVNEVLRKRINFEKGYLIVEALKTATFIDVNGNGYPLEVNLRAVPQIVKQINVKRLGGIVVVDFLNLTARRERSVLKEKLQKFLIETRTPCKVLGFTKAQHLELSCLKRGEPLTEALTEEHDLGRFKFWDILALEILEKILTYKGEDIKLKIHPLRKKVLNYLQKFYVGRIEPLWDCFVNPDRFQILIS